MLDFPAGCVIMVLHWENNTPGAPPLVVASVDENDSYYDQPKSALDFLRGCDIMDSI